MPERLIHYVPIDYAEAVGRAAIGLAHLEAALDTLVAVSARAADPAFDWDVSTPEKLNPSGVVHDERLKTEWRDEIGLIANAVVAFRGDFENATYGTLYGRGVEGPALRLRKLYEKSRPVHVISWMTKGKVDTMSEEMVAQTRRAIDLATTIADSIRLFKRAESD